MRYTVTSYPALKGLSCLGHIHLYGCKYLQIPGAGISRLLLETGTIGPLNVTVTYRKGSIHRSITQRL